MKNTNLTLASKTGKSNIVRAKFGPGMLLQHGDLEQLNAYTRDLSRLLFRSLFGCGVICGLKVETAENCGKVNVTVGAGVGLTCSGDPVHVPKDETFPLDENCDPGIPSPLWVVLCRTTKCCAPRTSICADDDEATSECTRERDGYEIRVVKERPKCACGCPEVDANYDTSWETQCKCVNPNLECYEDHYEGKCGCTCDECSDCDCDCILLARLKQDEETDDWLVEHKYRRFVRPVLMRDPEAEREQAGAGTLYTKSNMIQQRVERAADAAAEETLTVATVEVAQNATQSVAMRIAQKLGTSSAKRVIEKIAIGAKEQSTRLDLNLTPPYETVPETTAPPVAEPPVRARMAKSATKAKQSGKAKPSK